MKQTDTNRKVSLKMGAAEILFFIFLTLKLAGFIDWSWWMVTSPLWIVYGLMLILSIAITILGGASKRSVDRKFNRIVERNRR